MYDIRLTYDYDQKYSEFVVSELVAGSRAQVMGHSTTTWTTFYPILTAYPLRVDNLPFVHMTAIMDFLLTYYPPILVLVVNNCPLRGHSQTTLTR